MTAATLTPRERRIVDLTSARDRIDAELERLTVTTQARARRARNLVWDGHTHAETAHTLGCTVEQVGHLLHIAQTVHGSPS